MNPSLKVPCKRSGRWPYACHMTSVPRPLAWARQTNGPLGRNANGLPFGVRFPITFPDYVSRLRFPITFPDCVSRLRFPITIPDYDSRLRFPITFPDYVSELPFGIAFRNCLSDCVSDCLSDCLSELRFAITFRDYVSRLRFGTAFRAEGPSICLAQANGLGNAHTRQRQGQRPDSLQGSIPNITLVDFNSMSLT